MKKELDTLKKRNTGTGLALADKHRYTTGAALRESVCTVLAQQPLQVGVPLIGRREAVPLVEWNADHPPASRREEAPLEQRGPVGFAHAPAVGQQEVRGAVPTTTRDEGSARSIE